MYRMETFQPGVGMSHSQLYDSTTACYRHLKGFAPGIYVKITYGQEASDGVFEVEEVIATFWTED